MAGRDGLRKRLLYSVSEIEDVLGLGLNETVARKDSQGVIGRNLALVSKIKAVLPDIGVRQTTLRGAAAGVDIREA